MQSESGIVPDFEVGEEFHEEPKTYYELKSQPLKSSSSEEHPGASKPPISSSSMTSRILLRQQLMREQMQEQERREQQQKLQAAQFMQQRVPVSQTPAINVSVPTTLPSATQVPMEVLKTQREEPEIGLVDMVSWLKKHHIINHCVFIRTSIKHAFSLSHLSNSD